MRALHGCRALKLWSLLVVASALAACAGTSPASPPAPAPQAPAGAVSGAALGESKASAIEVCMPQGQRAYLSRLRCTDGQAPAFERVGSVGPRTPLPEQDEGESKEAYSERLRALMSSEGSDHHIVDLYRVACHRQTHAIHMDMYHCKAPPPDQAPPGFSIVRP